MVRSTLFPQTGNARGRGGDNRWQGCDLVKLKWVNFNSAEVCRKRGMNRNRQKRSSDTVKFELFGAVNVI